MDHMHLRGNYEAGTRWLFSLLRGGSEAVSHGDYVPLQQVINQQSPRSSEDSSRSFDPPDHDSNMAELQQRRSHVDPMDEKEKPYDRPSLNDKDYAHEEVTYNEEDYAIKNDGRPFPVDPRLPEETHQLTFRAVIVGSLLGLIVGASNIYLGLKTGFTFGAALFGAIFGFAILKPMSHALPERFGGGYFGQKENATVQTAATSAGGLTSLFVAAVPAMYHLGLLTTPREDIGRLFLLTSITAFYGLFFAIPLRKYYILKQKLVFPSPTATAFTIRSLHSTSSPAARLAAGKKIKILGASFFISLGWKVLSAYAPGILWDWHVFWWIWTWGGKGAIAAESWGWWIELTPAFLSAGALSGLNASWSFLGGAILAWGVIGPALVKSGIAFGKPITPDIPGYMSYMGMVLKDPINKPSPRYWMLWPGVFIMLLYSFAEVAWSSPLFYRSFKSAFKNIGYTYRQKRAARSGAEFNESPPPELQGVEDPAPSHEQVPLWGWAGGLLLSATGTLVVGKLSFDMDVGIGILALILAFILSFIGVQSSGTTDVNPVGTIAKASQLIVGGVTKGQGISVQKAQTTNLIAGSIAGQAASHAVDMVGDLKTGHLLGAAPAGQFWAQVFGSVIGIWLSVGLFVLFASAYPCITDMELECTAFGMPAVAAWRSVAVAVTKPQLPIPKTSGYTAIGLGMLAVITIPIKYLLVPEKYHKWVPNWNAIGLGFVVPQTYYPIAMVIGAHVAHFWEKRNPKSWEVWGFALAAGMIAGEGMGGVLTALLVIVKADGAIHGSAVACPAYEYCG